MSYSDILTMAFLLQLLLQQVLSSQLKLRLAYYNHYVDVLEATYQANCSLRNLSSDSVVALGQPDRLLSYFSPVSECLLMVKKTVLTDTLTFFAVSL